LVLAVLVVVRQQMEVTLFLARLHLLAVVGVVLLVMVHQVQTLVQLVVLVVAVERKNM
jgi:hypothetical protein